MHNILFCFSLLLLLAAAARAVPLKITVDSSSPGYDSAILSDGKWIEKGAEKNLPFSHPDSLGNCGNTWVSGREATTHWIRLDWEQPVILEALEICWSLPQWYPLVFRLERLEDDRWVPLGPEAGWMAVTDRRCVIPLPKTPFTALRIVQPVAGPSPRDLMAAQEVRAIETRGSKMLQGARRMADAAFARLTPPTLERNIARLDDHGTGASKAVRWSPEGVASDASELADGNLVKTAATLASEGAVGVQWPIEHSLDGAALIVAERLPDPAFLSFEVHDGSRWIPVTCNKNCRVMENQRRIKWSFEQIATKAARIRMLSGSSASSVAEIEIYRYLPASKYEWPARLTEKVGIKQEYLASAEEPSFESLALAGLPMRTTRFSLGLKDMVHESGITLDGTILDHETIEFRFGNEQFRLGDFPDTLQRVLIDGWRPGVIIKGRLGKLEVSQTAYAFPLEDEPTRAGVFVRFSLRNLSEHSQKSFLRTDVLSDRPGALQYRSGALMRGATPVFVAISPNRVADSTNALCVDYDLAPAEEFHADYVYFPEAQAPQKGIEALRTLTFESTLAKFRGYWDERLKSSTVIEVPEPQVNRMMKAVLAQIFVNGDGDIMPYGSAPSMYEGDLFGVEEGYPMLALSLFGFDREAERYLEGTYLHDQFLQKVAQYHP